jgi:hypothetical protein
MLLANRGGAPDVKSALASRGTLTVVGLMIVVILLSPFLYDLGSP